MVGNENLEMTRQGENTNRQHILDVGRRENINQNIWLVTSNVTGIYEKGALKQLNDECKKM